MKPIEANYANPVRYQTSPIAARIADQVQNQIVQARLQAQTSLHNYSYAPQPVVPSVSDWAIPANAYGLASVAHQAAAMQRAILNSPVGQWGARGAMTQMYGSHYPEQQEEVPVVEEPIDEPEAHPDHPTSDKKGRETIRQKGGRGADFQKAKGGKGRDKIVQKGGRGADTQKAFGGAGSDLIRQKGGRGSDRQVAKGGRGADRIVQKQGKGQGTSVIKGGKGQDQAVIFAGKNIKVVGANGEVLFEKGNGSKVVRVKSVENVRVKNKKKVLFQS
jgi:hypothetical protein